MLKNKRAIESEVLIGIIITVLVAAVIFWFLYLHNASFGGIIDREACHQSVLMRSIPTVIGTPLRTSIPLKCRTEDIIINFDDEEIIKQRMANAMHDCWWMLGEGKLNFYALGLTRENYCIICSTIDFSGKAENKIIPDFQDYLQTEIIPTTNLTYMQYVSNNEDADVNVLGEKQSIDTNQKYAVVFSFFKRGVLSNLVMGATTGAIVGSVVPGLGNFAGFIIGGAIGWITQTWWENFISGTTSDYFASIYLVPYEPEQFKPCTKMDAIP